MTIKCIVSTWKNNSPRSMWAWWTCSLTHLWEWTFHCTVSTGNLVQFNQLCFSRLAPSCYFCGPGCTKLSKWCNKGCVGKQFLLCVKHLLSLINISPVANNVPVYILCSLWKLVIVNLLQLIYYSYTHEYSSLHPCYVQAQENRALS